MQLVIDPITKASGKMFWCFTSSHIPKYLIFDFLTGILSSDLLEMQKIKSRATRGILPSCRAIKLPLFVLFLCTMVTVLYKSWDVVFYSKVSVSTQHQNVPDTTLITVKHTSSPIQTDSKPRLFRSGDLSPSKSQGEEQKDQETIEVVMQPTMQPERRRSLLIYGADRSGTTFTTKMFAEDPQMMTVYEPLWVTRRWNIDDAQQRPKWRRNVLDVLSAILGCKFAKSEAGTKFLSHTSKKWSGAFVKNPFTSPAFCVNDICKDLSTVPSFADDVCRTKFKHSVTKIGEPRTPDRLVSSFLPAVFSENPDTDVRVIQLIRDPRASFSSRIKLHWMPDYHSPNFRNRVSRVCSNLAENIKIGRNLGKWHGKYLEVHYRDLAGKPIETTKGIYKFAGFEMPDSVVDWVVQNTSPSKEELLKEQHKTFSSVRNSTENVDKWQKDAPIERIRIIEGECREAFDLLGLTRIT